ncbi:hypothetical protein BDV59DRAFT_209046 [Aspergillus ambiguus]|uniref:uncharacterized protein n=1 Tax=Aspergillus ambiguus TaxID=176160 RepID=UPI003CCDF987
MTVLQILDIKANRGEFLMSESVPPIRDWIERIAADLEDIKAFFRLTISPQRTHRLRNYLTSELDSLNSRPLWEAIHDIHLPVHQAEDNVDYLLLRNYLKRQLRELDLGVKQDEKAAPLLPFASPLLELVEARALIQPMVAPIAAQKLFDTNIQITELIEKIRDGSDEVQMEKTSAFRAARTIDMLREELKEWFAFYNGYDHAFDWWVSHPFGVINKSLEDIASIIREQLVHIQPGDEDAIVGQPIGREGLLAELEAEMIPYSPEEIISIGEKEFEWCVNEMKKASESMGYGDDWRLALEQVKNEFVEPGKQTQLVRDHFSEAVKFVEQHDLVTVPPVAKQNWQMFMMSPERQKFNPFFLGGDSIIVSYPTQTMDHGAKLMSMRGNNYHFSRATVFHEMIPGHHLQLHMNARHRPYRRLFDTPFSIEGWALYWEFLLWDDNRFEKTPENRIGMLFWRLHRCARIIFSVSFHLGKMTPSECINLLVNGVGHERATAEAEVRRSLNGDYSPLYQAGYMLVLDTQRLTEKEFHDAFLQKNCVPIELVRANFLDIPLSKDYKASWRFYPL